MNSTLSRKSDKQAANGHEPSRNGRDSLDQSHDRLTELETRLAFQDDAIEQLNAVITRQDKDIRQLQHQLQEVVRQTRQLHEQLDPEVTDDAPPHY